MTPIEFSVTKFYYREARIAYYLLIGGEEGIVRPDPENAQSFRTEVSTGCQPFVFPFPLPPAKLSADLAEVRSASPKASTVEAL